MTADDTDVEDPLVEVVLLRYPLRLAVRASQHYEEVFREFALLAASRAEPAESVPVRLLRLIDALGRRYARQEALEAERDAALARGEAERDFTIQVPRSVASASQVLGTMLDETDEFCRKGMLLTLAAPEDVVAFRRWYLQELVNQIDGGAPTPWTGPLTRWLAADDPSARDRRPENPRPLT